MPTQTPISGLSLILHLVIILLVSVFKMLGEIASIFKIKTPYNYFNYLVNKEGDTYIRRTASYLIVFVVLLSTMGVGLAVTSLGKSTTLKAGITQTIASIRSASANKLADNSSSYTVIEVEETKIANEREESELILGDVSLVDNLREIGVNNPTFDLRALLAEEGGIVSSELEYQGTEKQNLSILRKLNRDPSFKNTIYDKFINNNSTNF